MSGKQARIQHLMHTAFDAHQRGALSAAEASFREILSLFPRHAEALHGLGVVLQEQGQAEASIPFIEQALTNDAGNPVYSLSLGNAYLDLHQYDNAIAAFAQALRHPQPLPEAHNSMGIAQKARGDLDGAIASFQNAIAQRPDYAHAYNNLGTAYQESGQMDAAAAAFNEAIRLNPQLASAYNNMAMVHLARLNTAQAIAALDKALALAPRFAEAANNLGIAWKQQGATESAIASYLNALSIDPRYVEAYFNLGVLLQENDRLNEAEACYRQILSLRPEHAEALYNLGQLLKDRGQIEAAMECIEHAIAARPDYPAAENTLIHLRQHVCAWHGLDELVDKQRARVRSDPNARITPFSFLTTDSSAEEQLICARNWVTNTLSPYVKLGHTLGFDFSGRRHERIKLGYLSADFHEHATAYLIAELLELHDRQHFEVFAYSYGPDDASPIRRRLQEACAHFCDIRALSHIEAAKQIYRDEIDILVDLKGYTQNTRDQILALRPAPVQINWLGYPGTMGAKFMDYIVADAFIIPPEHERYYAEQVIRLPDCYQVNDRKRRIDDTPLTRAELGLPTEGMVYCSFNQTYKITPQMFAVWMTILQQVEGSVLWLLASNPHAVDNLRREAQLRGIEPARLVFADKRPLAQHLARLRLADLCLDTYPVNSHTTASDALWAGCPLLTYAGETFVSRVAGSLLETAGLPELITYNLGDYQSMAIRLGTEPQARQALRARLAHQRDRCALFDTELFARNWERALTTVAPH